MTHMRPIRTRPTPLAWIFMLPVRFYRRFISPMTPPSCRYYPVCSSYALGALRTHGGFKGALLIAWRLLRCNPWSKGGVDKVPERGRWRWREDTATHQEHSQSQDAAEPADLGRAIAPGYVINTIAQPAHSGARETIFAQDKDACAPRAGRSAA